MARAFQSRHSRYWPGSRTAKIRSCVAWKASSTARTSSSDSSRERYGHVQLPHLRAIAGLDEEVPARLGDGQRRAARSGTRPPERRPPPTPRSPPRGRATVSPRTDCGRTRRRCLRRARRRPRARLPSTAASTRRHPSSRAIGTMFRPEAPPPATRVTSLGSMPCAIVISRIAPTMFSEAIVSAA